jgi:hypothetical protein
MTISIPERLLTCLVSIVLVLVCACCGSAQYPGSLSSGMNSTGGSSRSSSAAGSYFGGGSTYLPFGGSMGGFVPYSAGPGGGLGVMREMRENVTSMGPRETLMLDRRPALGQMSGSLTPLTPIGSGVMGSPAGGAMGSMGAGLIKRPASRGAMGGMARPPVGGYPFRQPPSLLGPATAGPAMSM